MSGRLLLQLYTTMDEFETLHERHDRTRSTSRTVTEDCQALMMSSALRGKTEPFDRHSPVRVHCDLQHFVPRLPAAQFRKGEKEEP